MTSFFKWNQRISSYTLDSTFSSSLNRLGIYTLRKFPSLQSIFKGRVGKWPERIELKNKEFKILPATEDECKVIYLGHKTVYIQIEGANLMTDPVLAKRLFSGGLGVKRVTKKRFSYWEFPPADFLLISNNSYDCFDSWTIRRITDQGGAIAVGGRGLGGYLNMFFERFTYPLDYFEEVDFGSVKITFLPSYSNTKRKKLSCGIDRNRLVHGSFLVRGDRKHIYYAGRTAYSGHFKEIGEYLASKNYTLDAAILPLGPRFRDKINMEPEDIVKAHLDLKSKRSIVVGCDTFPLGIEGYNDLKRELREIMSSSSGTNGGPQLTEDDILMPELEEQIVI